MAQTGYMPVRNGAFDDIETYDKFPEPVESYQQLYAALKTMRENDTPVSEPRFKGYYGRVSVLYDGLRQLQKELPKRAAAGEDIDALACPVLRHRVKLSYEAMAERVTPDEVIARLVDDMKKKRR